jgi:pantothenate kinase
MNTSDDAASLVERARALLRPGQRVILGITGAPGSGKSTLAARIVAALAPRAVLVPMDGFHLAGAVLDALGRTDRKGAIDTFDAYGYVALLRRLRARDEPIVYAPEFRREIEEPIACAIGVPADCELVVTEGNYLLAPSEPWGEIRAILDAVWYLDLDEDVRIARLIARHERYGRTPEAARERALGSDQRNADLIGGWRHLADLVITGARGCEPLTMLPSSCGKLR